MLLDETTTNRDEGDQNRPIALFAERAVETRDIEDSDYGFVRHEVLPFFPGTDEGRATGAGMPPIVVDPSDQEVGSEGAIANFITGYERLHRNRVLSHPGPDALRTRRASHIVIVTDFIGSGKRAWEMLEAFWRVATIRNWHSGHLARVGVEGLNLFARSIFPKKTSTYDGRLRAAFRFSEKARKRLAALSDPEAG